MKYLVAYKPCGCPEDMIRHWPENIAIIAWREYHEGTGCKVLEGEPPELILPFCPHGSLPAQLVAKVAALEAREAELKEWLRNRIWEVEFARGLSVFTATPALADQFQGKLGVLREVLVKLDGNGQREGSKP